MNKKKQTKNSLSSELQDRGLVFQHTGNSLEDIFDKGQRIAYIGIDPTADSMHAGNLITYIFAERLLQAGHKVILLVGGATGLIGDPSGKDVERQLSTEKEVGTRTKRIAKQITSLSGLSKMPIVNNYDWYKGMSAIEFLRDIGKFFTVNAMIKKDSVSRRIASEDGISYTEFSYALLQSYDFYFLHKKYSCDLQVGGSDQWGNIISGVDFIRKKTGGTDVHGVTIPLIVEKSTGKKFGKSAGNAVWLDHTKTSYYDFYQFWLRTDDESAIEYLKFFTFLSLEEIDTLQKSMLENPHLREAQKSLAYEVTSFVHGKSITENIKKVTDLMFGNIPLSEMAKTELKLINAYVPIAPVSNSVSIIDLLVEHGLCSSKGEARQLIKGGGIKINEQKINLDTKLNDIPTMSGLVMLSKGNKQRRIFKIT